MTSALVVVVGFAVIVAVDAVFVLIVVAVSMFLDGDIEFNA